MSQLSDSYLLDLLRNGDIKAFDKLYIKYYKFLYANAYLILRDEQVAKDIVQVFFVEMWERKSFNGLEGDIRGYLYRAIQNRSFNAIRRQNIELKRYETLESLDIQEETSDIWEERTHSNLQEALLMMPGQRREAINLVYLQEKKYQEAASVMGISVNSLKTHLKIGLKVLRDKLKP